MGLREDINKTIEYAAKFDCWLDKSEIKERLLSSKFYKTSEINTVLKTIKRENKENKWFEEKIGKARKLAKELEKKFSDILFVGASGSVASSHPKITDDIDILIITKTNKLWKNRLNLRWWIFKNKIPHRKYGEQGKRDDFCFNLWLDETSLYLPKEKQNLKNAVDLILLKPLVNKSQTYEKFILANDWAKKWIKTPYMNKIKDSRFMIQDSKIKQNIFERFMNYFYFWPQYIYMKRNRVQKTVGLHQAFFHSQMVK